MNGAGMVAEALDTSAEQTVLVVEDEVVLRALLAEGLRTAGFAVMEAANGEEALNVLRSPLKVNAVVTDLAMPKMDGAMLVRTLQSEFPYLKVTMVSGQVPAADVHQALHGYFAKPIEPSRVAEHLQLMCDQRLQPDGDQ